MQPRHDAVERNEERRTHTPDAGRSRAPPCICCQAAGKFDRFTVMLRDSQPVRIHDPVNADEHRHAKKCFGDGLRFKINWQQRGCRRNDPSCTSCEKTEIQDTQPDGRNPIHQPQPKAGVAPSQSVEAANARVSPGGMISAPTLRSCSQKNDSKSHKQTNWLPAKRKGTRSKIK